MELDCELLAISFPAAHIRAAQAIKSSGDGFTEGDINSIKRLLTSATLPGIRSLVEYLGVPEVERAVGVD